MRRAVALAAALALGGGALGQGATDWGFMPEGGRGLLATVFGTGPEAARALDRSGDEATWAERIAATGAGLEAREARVLAGYLAVNAPIADPSVAPPDGRDLALARCQSCHSLFSGTLMQRRDVVGWEAVFKAPFHSGLPMTEAERRTFAAYAAVAMPLRPEDVPPELRF